MDMDTQIQREMAKVEQEVEDAANAAEREVDDVAKAAETPVTETRSETKATTNDGNQAS